MKSIQLVVITLAGLIAIPAFAQDKPASNMEILRQKIKADKKLLVAVNMDLTESEAKGFWPVYDAYQRDVEVADRRRAVVVEAIVVMDKPLTNLYAKTLANELIAADEQELKARRTLHNRLIKPLPGRAIMSPAKAARYLQLESKIRAMKAYDIATTIPLVK